MNYYLIKLYSRKDHEAASGKWIMWILRLRVHEDLERWAGVAWKKNGCECDCLVLYFNLIMIWYIYIHTQLIYSYWSRLKLNDKRNAILPHQRVEAIQEEIAGFILEEVMNPKGEYHNPKYSYAIWKRRMYDIIAISIHRIVYMYICM